MRFDPKSSQRWEKVVDTAVILTKLHWQHISMLAASLLADGEQKQVVLPTMFCTALQLFLALLVSTKSRQGRKAVRL